jgi:hypothetical protein
LEQSCRFWNWRLGAEHLPPTTPVGPQHPDGRTRAAHTDRAAPTGRSTRGPQQAEPARPQHRLAAQTQRNTCRPPHGPPAAPVGRLHTRLCSRCCSRPQNSLCSCRRPEPKLSTAPLAGSGTETADLAPLQPPADQPMLVPPPGAEAKHRAAGRRWYRAGGSEGSQACGRRD